MAGTPIGDANIDNCCQCNLAVLQVIAFCVPQATVDWTNGIVAGYAGGDIPGCEAGLPTPPTLTSIDWLDALQKAYDVVMAVDFSAPPVAWSPAGSITIGTFTFPMQTIQAILWQDMNVSSPIDGTASNPPGHWYNTTFSTIFGIFASDAANYPACDESSNIVGLESYVEMVYDTPHYGLGPGLGQFDVCDGDTGIYSPFAIATRTKIFGRPQLCVSGRKRHISSGYSPCAFTLSHIGSCGLVTGSPTAGIVIDPPNPSGGFDFASFGVNGDEIYRQGNGAWLLPCTDCVCP